MDNVILDVVLGLVLIYALMALLVMSLQEALAGGLLKSRVTDLHALLKEATGHDDELHKRIVDNTLVFSLYEGEKSARQGVLRSSGPSEIPPDVFTRALLIEVDPAAKGKPPSERFATPQEFVDDLLKKIPDKKTVNTLRALLPGREADWPGFEAAISAWFAHIGDRAKGWYKRRSARTSFLLALLLAAVLNVDTFYLTSALAGDPEVRTSVARLAERVSADRERAAGDGATATAAPALGAPTPQSAEARVSARLADAYNRLRPLYFRDDEIAAFGHQLAPVETACKGLLPEKPGSDTRVNRLKSNFASNSDAWIDLLPVLQTQIELILAGSVDLLQPPADTTNTSTIKANSDPSKSAASAPATARVADSASDRLRKVHGCLTHVSAWVRAATTASKDGATQRTMQEIAQALEDAKASLLELIGGRLASVSLKNLFRSEPEAFAECLRTESTLAAVRRCTETGAGTIARLPIGHTTYNRLRQFCVVTEKVESRSGGLMGECDVDGLERSGVPANLQLNTPAMALDSSGWRARIAWLVGILVTTFFVTLGAPFWFDLLSKVTNIRAAGRRAEAADAAIKANGTLPLLQPSAGAGSQVASSSGPSTPASPAFSSGEPVLTRREIVALQQRIGVVPATGDMDSKTRLKLKEAQDGLGLGATDRITAAAYLALVGRSPSGDPAMVVGAVGRPMLHQPYSAAQALAANLVQRLSFTSAQQAAMVPANTGEFSDDLRALAVLYRYRSGAASDRSAKVFSLATDNPAALDQIDELMLNELLSPTSKAALPRHPTAPWLDWAIGELGQVERGANNRKASNPRVCTYLDSVAKSLGDAGDRTPWCAAFVNWVVERHFAIDVPSGLPTFSTNEAASSALAKEWANWGSSSSADSPAVGDVVVLRSKDSSSGYHVGFCFEVDQANNKVYVLGGNQTGGSRVSLTAFALPVFAARR